MKILKTIIVLSLAGLAVSAPTSNDDEFVITKDMYPKDALKYSGGHEIVNILVPINNINNNDHSPNEYNPKSNEVDIDVIIFFVEADFDSEGNRIDRGLYVLKHGKATKLLEHGRDAAASTDDSKLVFFGAADGIYVYDKEKNSAEKYGKIDDNIIGIEKEKTGDVIYILTENHEVFKVSDNGLKKEKIDDIAKAKQIVLDYSDNLYFYSDDKQPYVRTADGIKKIEGLPENPKSVHLIKPPFAFESEVMFFVDNKVYYIDRNGESSFSGIEFKPDAIPSAYAPEALFVQYYAHDKKIYELNLFSLIFGEIGYFENYFNTKAGKMQLYIPKILK